MTLCVRGFFCPASIYVFAATSMMAAAGDEYWDNRFSLPGLDGPVAALATDGTNLYAGGSFRFAGPLQVNGLAKWDGTNWSSLGNGLDGSFFSVAALAVNGSNVYVGSYFDSVSGVPATNIARWNGKNWMPLGGGANDLVTAIVVKGNHVYAGGYFDVIGGVTAHRVARWDGTNWSALGTGLEGYCLGLKFVGEDLYANVLTNVLRWDGHTWSALAARDQHPESVYAMEVAGQNLIAAGGFRLTNGTGALTIGRWDGSSWAVVAPGLNASIEAIAVVGSDIYVKGGFDGVANSFDYQFNGIARWDGSSWSPVGEGIGYYSNRGALAAIGNDLYAGGDPYNHKLMAKWDGTRWSSLDGQGGLGISGGARAVNAIAVSGRRAYVGGWFSQAGGVTSANLALWDGTNWSTVGGFDGPLDYVVATSNVVYVAGGFTAVDGVAASGIAKWDGANWSAVGNPPYGRYVAFAAQGEKVYVANSASAGPFGPYIYEWNGTNWAPLGGGIWGAYGIEVSMPVRSFAISGRDVYVGGMFNEVGGGGVRATNLARWDGTNWWPVGGGVQFEEPGVGTTAIVLALAIRDHELYVAGNFNYVGGASVTNASNIARWDGTNWFTFGSGLDGYASAMALSGDELYVGGAFQTAGEQPAARVARWNGTTWSALGSGISGPDYVAVSALALSGSDLLVGGEFSFAGGKPASGGFSIWHAPQLLEISRVSGRLNFSWPTHAMDFVLETANVLPGTNWSILPEPQVMNGRYTLAIDPPNTNRFFRLRRP